MGIKEILRIFFNISKNSRDGKLDYTIHLKVSLTSIKLSNAIKLFGAEVD